MFKKGPFLILNLVAIMSLTSCFLKTDLKFEPYEQYIDEINTKFDQNGDGFYKIKEYDDLEYLDFQGNTHVISSFRDIFSNTNNNRTYLNMKSTGEQKLLVLPISFKDSDKSNQAAKKIYIQNAFFGKPEKTVHESVASYYNEVSYGHLKLSGKVADFFEVDYSGDDLLSLGTKTNVSRYITSLALDYYKSLNDDIYDFDNDKDGYIDGVVAVYDYPFANSNNSLFWAYVDHMNKNEAIYLDKKTIFNQSEPYASMYGWMSIDFMKQEYNYVDSHVYIHEFGHILGLQDYYSDNKYQPTGYMDMMDYNLGDHNAFTKMLLNWTTPYVITGDCTIKLKPSYKSGDCIIIPSINAKNGDLGWNKTPYDEMLVIEFYAPQGVNAYDATLSFNYENSNKEQKIGKLFTNYGIKVYHVDSRIGYVKNKSLSSYIALLGDKDLKTKLDNYKKQCEESGTALRWCLDFPFNNKDKNHPYIKLIESNGKNTLINGECATNNSLFKKGQDFGQTCYQDFKFYDQSGLPFTFKVESISAEEAILTFKTIK